MTIELLITTDSTGEELEATFDNVEEAIQWIKSVDYEDSARLDNE